MADNNLLKKMHEGETQEQAKEQPAEAGQESAPSAAPPEPSFKERLDMLDELIQHDQGITLANIDRVRSYVKRVATELKEQPELDAILIDRDVHNILRVIRADKDRAVEALTEKVEKKKKSAAKKSTKGLEGFGLEDLGMPSDLGELGNMKT